MKTNGMSRSYVVKHLYHLGFVSGMCDYLGLVDLIDSKLGKSFHQKLSYGQIIKGMIINGLGYVSQPIYLVADFFKDKAIDRLIGEGVEAGNFNESVIGRGMDACYEYGVSNLYIDFASQALDKLKLSAKIINIDSTSFHVDGKDYDSNMDAKSITITKGYSRDHRPELNQAVLQLIVENQSGIPLHMKALSGNVNDKKSFCDTIKQHVASLYAAFKHKYIVGDSALYIPETIREINKNENYFVTCVPATIKEAKELLNLANPQWLELKDGYFAYEQILEYAGVTQRYILFASTYAKNRELKTIIRRVSTLSTQEYKRFEKLCNKKFACEADAKNALAEFEESCKLISLQDANITAYPHYKTRGKPKHDQQPDYYDYIINANVCTSLTKVNDLKAVSGRFVLATNDLSDAFTMQEVLSIYKSQQRVERGFRFMKSPEFLTSAFYVKTPARIEVLLMIMTMCLLVYAALEYTIRQELQRHNKMFINQKNKQCNNPTARWIFFCFQSITIVHIKGVTLPIELEYYQQQIIDVLGGVYAKIYS